MDVDEDEEDQPVVVMGENDAAMEYDEEHIFRHLFVRCLRISLDESLTSSSCFYLDTPDNARANGMAVKGKHEADISRQ
jgi:DNA ligase-4